MQLKTLDLSDEKLVDARRPEGAGQIGRVQVSPLLGER